MNTLNLSASTPYPIPDVFVWSRIGPESGEPLDGVLECKERQRAANGLVFAWGIGHSIKSGIQRLLQSESEPVVLFTRIRGKGATIDLNPAGLLLWRCYYDDDGETRPLPRGAIVVSRSHTKLVKKSRHYALFCESRKPLELKSRGQFRRDDVVNIGSGRTVGSSQTTAVVRRIGGGQGSFVEVMLAARLFPPYTAQLADPIAVSAQALAQAYAKDDLIGAIAALMLLES